MNKARTIVLSAIFSVCVLSAWANACEPFIDLDKVGKFEDTPNYPVIDNDYVRDWFRNHYSGCNDSNFSWGGKDRHHNWSGWNRDSWDFNWTHNHCGNWNFGKWHDKPCGGGGEIPEPTCTVLTLAGTGILCLLRRKK